MRIAGAIAEKRRKPFVFEDLKDEKTGKPLQVELEPLRIGWEVDVLGEIGMPSAPLKVVGRGPDGPNVVPNPEDGAYKLRALQGNALQAAAMIMFALQHDERFTYETDPALRKSNGVKYWAGVYNELRDSDITSKDFSRLISAISEISGVKDDEIEKAKTAFLQRTEESETDSSSS